LSRSVLLTAFLVATLVFVSACAQESSEHSLVLTGPEGQTEEQQPVTPDSLDDVVNASLADDETFWRETYPQVYVGEYEEISGGFFPYGPDTETPPCGPRPLDYEEIANNAFYCPTEDLVAWDEATLIPDLAEQFGPFTIGIVFAHELGHAIQFRSGDTNFPTLILEMQADCFAGAWTGWIAEGNSDDFAVTESELDNSVAGMTAIRDIPGTGADDPLAHGLAFDRVGSFQDGFENGAARCAEYPTANLPIVEIPFTTEEEIASGGNLHLEDRGPDEPGLLSLSVANLNVFYQLVFEDLGAEWQPVEDLVILDSSGEDLTCDGQDLNDQDLGFASGYCEDENVAVLGQDLTDALNGLGDFAVASEIARLWTRAAQLQLDVDIDDVPAASLQADCLTGAWADANFPIPLDDGTTTTELRDDVPEDQRDEPGVSLQLSPGDLDESIQGFLTYGDQLAEETGTVFERTGALRDGFVTGIEACAEFAPFD
jgi:predicted metalloprotease